MRTPWINEALRDQPCQWCQKQLATARVEAIGVADPEYEPVDVAGPCALLKVRCWHCRHRNALLVSVDGSMLMKAVQRFYREHEEASLRKDLFPPPQRPKRQPIRPSIRATTPQAPITAADLRRFVRQLERTSMKRSTKSFKEWLRRLTRP